MPTILMKREPYFPCTWQCQVDVIHPVAFSLVTALEKEQHKQHGYTANRTQSIDADNIEELSRLMGIAELGLGFRFFDTKYDKRDPLNAAEAHWRGIEVNPESGETTCQFCKHYNDTLLYKRIAECEEADSCLRAHCSDVYQPLKKFMLQHLKHVRYVRPPRGWRDNDLKLCGLLRPYQDLVAGFTSAGVLCGFYVMAPDLPGREQALADTFFQSTRRVNTS